MLKVLESQEVDAATFLVPSLGNHVYKYTNCLGCIWYDAALIPLHPLFLVLRLPQFVMMVSPTVTR